MAKALKFKKVKIGRINTSMVMGKCTPMMDTNGKAYSAGTAHPAEVMAMLIEAKGGRDITVYKSANFSSGSIHPRKLVSVTDSMTADEKDMYIQLCKLAAE